MREEYLFNSAFCWYPFREGSEIVCVSETGGRNFLEGMCAGNGLMIHTAKAGMDGYKGKADYILTDQSFEKAVDPVAIFRTWRSSLKQDGVLLMCANNRLGIRNFCGDKDPYTWKSFDGVDDYRYSYLYDLRQVRKKEVFRGRCYDESRLKDMLSSAGFPYHRIMDVFPGLENPYYIIDKEYDPAEDIATRIFPMCRSKQSVIMDERLLYPSLVKNGLLHPMSNAFLIECTPDGVTENISQVTCSLDRDKNHATATVISGSSVEKRFIFPEGKSHLKNVKVYADMLEERGIQTVPVEMTQSGVKMPFIKAPTGQKYLQDLFRDDIDGFLNTLDHFRDLILQSSEHVDPNDEEYLRVRKERKKRYEERLLNEMPPESLEDIFAEQLDDEGVILRYGFLEMVPLNSFFVDGEFVFFDQEYMVEYCPANALICRMIATFYSSNYEEGYNIYPDHDLLDRYGLMEYRRHWEEMEWRFLDLIKEKENWEDFYDGKTLDVAEAYENRKRLMYHPFNQKEMFEDALSNLDGFSVYVFGSGKYADSFMDLYSMVCDVRGVVDNNSGLWGKDFHGFSIASPDVLRSISGEEICVMICVKDYFPIMQQLDKMELYCYRIYDAKKIYPREINAHNSSESVQSKPYHIGYISGVFDLFHKGHLNLLRRAKDKCEYLIVGVVSDAGVRIFKNVEPFIPFEERREMVEACKYVDEAVEIPLYHRGVRDAYKLYHFDCQFCGSDYLNDPVFMADKEWLKEQGSNMEVLPYTESTSSTKIKALIEKRLA